jgi:hypothetical protein
MSPQDATGSGVAGEIAGHLQAKKSVQLVSASMSARPLPPVGLRPDGDARAVQLTANKRPGSHFSLDIGWASASFDINQFQRMDQMDLSTLLSQTSPEAKALVAQLIKDWLDQHPSEEDHPQVLDLRAIFIALTE